MEAADPGNILSGEARDVREENLGDQKEGLVDGGLYLFGMEEGKLLCAALIVIMELRPMVVDSGVVAIFDHARNPDGGGESEAEVRRS